VLFRSDVLNEKGFVKVSLAGPMKGICESVFGFSHQQLYGESKYRNEGDRRYLREDGTLLTPREALQTLGTEFGRKCYPDIWVDILIREYNKENALKDRHNTNYVVADVRFINEIKKLRQYGPVIRIERPVDGLEGKAGEHISETSLDSIPKGYFDACIVNDSSLINFRRSVLNTVNSFMDIHDLW
jgi:hypothetical protein